MLHGYAMLPLLLLPACGMWIYEEPDDGSEISWYGTILDGPYTGDNGVLSGGEVLAYDLEGELLAEGVEPDEDTPGYWKLRVPPETPVAVHLAGEGMIPTVWRGRTPGAVGYWYTGALFAYLEETWLPFFEQFESQAGIDFEPLGEDVCWLWGAPWDPEAWTGASLELTDHWGERAALSAWHLNEDGLLAPAGPQDPIHYFLAFDLPPGDVSLHVEAADGRAFEETWPAWPGEVVSAFYLALPLE